MHVFLITQYVCPGLKIRCVLLSLELRNKIFQRVFYRAIKHGSELRCVEIQIQAEGRVI